MKKKILALLLALVIAVSMAACGEAAPDPTKAPEKETTVPAVETTEPVKETQAPETTAPAEETTAPTEPAQFPDVRYRTHFPVLENFGKAELVDVSESENGSLFLVFDNVSQDEAELFLAICSWCGLYSRETKDDDGATVYYLLRPGDSFIAAAARKPGEKQMVVQIQGDCAPVSQAEVEVMAEYYLQDMAIPGSFGSNVMPQFYASIGRTRADTDGLVSNIFRTESETCWVEVYYEMDYSLLHRYLSDMMVCGFEIWFDNLSFGEDGSVSSSTLMLSNGTSRIAVNFDAESEMAIVYYEPGVDRYLLSGAEYQKYIPQP